MARTNYFSHDDDDDDDDAAAADDDDDDEAKKKIYVCLRSPDPPYFSAADPNLFYWQLFHPNFC